MKKLVLLLSVSFTVFFLFGFLIGKASAKKNSSSYSDLGIPTTEGDLKEGVNYEVENFHLTSWGYLAQMKQEGHIVSRQYRLTSVTNLNAGSIYRVEFKKDPTSITGDRAFLIETVLQ